MIRKILNKLFIAKEMGFVEHGEEFTRWKIFDCRWFTVYIHRLVAPKFLPTSHDHPWDFVSIILWGGYNESINCGKPKRKYPGFILWRPASTIHNVQTPSVCWSLIFCNQKYRKWSFDHCRSFQETQNASS